MSTKTEKHELTDLRHEIYSYQQIITYFITFIALPYPLTNNNFPL